MTPKFITLPSGTRMNTSKIISYRKEDNGVAIFTTEGPFMAPESMTLEQMDALLSPPQSAVVSPILELRLPRRGEAVCFQWEEKQRHGIVQSFEVEDDKILIISDGESFQYDLPSAFTVKLQ
jgi:hypothetical protein